MPAWGKLFHYSPGHGSHHCPWGKGWWHHSCGHHQHNPSCRHTCSARKRYFSFIDLTEHPHLLSKKMSKAAKLILNLFSQLFFLVSQDLEMWRFFFLRRASSSITAHKLPGNSRTLIPCIAWLWGSLDGFLLYFQVFREWHRLCEWQKEELISKLPAFNTSRRAFAHLTSLKSATGFVPFFSTLCNAPLIQWGEAAP